MAVSTRKNKKEKIADSSAKRLKTPSCSRDLPRFPDFQKVRGSPPPDRWDGGVGPSPPELSAEVTRQVVELFICTATVLVPTTSSSVESAFRGMSGEATAVHVLCSCGMVLAQGARGPGFNSNQPRVSRHVPALLRLTVQIHVARRAPRFLSARELYLYVATGRPTLPPSGSAVPDLPHGNINVVVAKRF